MTIAVEVNNQSRRKDPLRKTDVGAPALILRSLAQRESQSATADLCDCQKCGAYSVNATLRLLKDPSSAAQDDDRLDGHVVLTIGAGGEILFLFLIFIFKN